MDTFFNRWPCLVLSSLGESSGIFITRLFKCSVVRTRINELASFCATDFNGFSDRQCGMCSKNRERQRFVRRNLLHVGYFLSLYIIAALQEFVSTGLLGLWLV